MSKFSLPRVNIWGCGTHVCGHKQCHEGTISTEECLRVVEDVSVYNRNSITIVSELLQLHFPTFPGTNLRSFLIKGRTWQQIFVYCIENELPNDCLISCSSCSRSERAGRSGRPASFDSDASDDDDSKKHRGSILPGTLITALQRFDNLTLGGGRFLRFNTPARVLLALYLLLLHAWVLLVWSVQSDPALAAGVNHAVGGAASKEVSDVWLPGRGH